MSNARQLAANLPREGALSNRNLIINGAMQVAQRGTSFTADNVYTLDRWKSGDGTGGTPARTLSQETFTLGQTDVPNAHYYLRHNQTGASTNGNASLNQKIEDVTRFDGVAVTLSFYAKANAAMDIDVRFIQDFGTGGTPSADVTLSETVSIGTSWQLYTVTKTLGSLSGKTLGTDGVHTSFLSLDIEFQPITTFTFDATLLQLEVGDTATPFEHPRSYGDELARCQRYYQYYPYVGEGTPLGIVHGYTFTNAVYKWATKILPVPMRAQPSITLESGSGTNLDNKARYVTTSGGQGGQDLSVYGVNTYNEGWDGISGSRNVNNFTSIVMKSYNEQPSTCYGFQAGFAADAEL